MKLLVLGASGRCGKWIVKLALERGHEVRSLVRDGTPFDVSEEAQVFRGSVLDGKVLSEAMNGCDAVLSGLGIKRKQSDESLV